MSRMRGHSLSGYDRIAIYLRGYPLRGGISSGAQIIGATGRCLRVNPGTVAPESRVRFSRYREILPIVLGFSLMSGISPFNLLLIQRYQLIDRGRTLSGT